jgi:1,2-phenylacetyl-CoA epoxidase catalytic subunit
MTQQFFNSVINHLQSHAEANVQAGDELLSQAQRGQEASRQLTQESVQAYMDFINSMFSFSQAGPEATQRGAESAT